LYDHKLPHRQLTAWLAAALIPTTIQLTAGSSWLSVLLVAALCQLCVWFRWRFGTEPQGKRITLLHLGLLTLILGTAAQAAIQSWPTGAHPTVSAVLLLLAAWSAWKGTSAAARVGCVLFWFVLLLYLMLLGAGLKDISVQWLLPTKGDVNSFGIVLLLTPAGAAIHLYNKRESAKPRLLLIGLSCTLAAVVTAGVLSAQVAAGKQNAFYEMTRSLNLLGQARRFEAVLSAGMTVGWFLVFNLYLTTCAVLSERIKQGRGKWGILGATASALAILLCDLHISGILLLILCAIFWVVQPVLTQWVEGIKKSKKSENSA
jgi:hypothetical protein